MSNELVGRCWLIDFPTPAMQLVMMKLADCADDDGSNVFPSAAYVARETLLSARAVSYQLAVLRECGLVINRRDAHGNRTNRTSVDREINIDLMGAIADTRVRGKPRVPSSHVIANVEVEVSAGATSVLAPGALAPSVFAEPIADDQAGVIKVWAIMPRGFDAAHDDATPATIAEADEATPAIGAGVPLQQLQGTPAMVAPHPCNHCRQPLLDSSLDSHPLTPKGECACDGLIDNSSAPTGWAAGWTEEAQAEVDRVRSSPVVSHIASQFIDGVRGILRPQKGADPAAYVRQLANHLRDFPPDALMAAATAMVEARNETLPGVGEVLKIARAAAEKLKSDLAMAAGAVAVSAADPALSARWPEAVIALRRQLGSDVVKAWFGPVAPVRRDGEALVLSAPKLNAQWIAREFEQQTLHACRSVWPDIAKIKLEAVRVAA